jgi:hypothetical protein
MRDLRILLPVIDHDGFIQVQAVVRHPEADLAVLRVPQINASEYLPFDNIEASVTWGDTVQALGYPEESEADGPVPTARLLTGTIQRFFTHSARKPHDYSACELSFGAPAGLSGGPVYNPRDSSRVIGVISDNHDSTTYLQAVEEIQESGAVCRQLTHELIRYGIAAHLLPLQEWLDTQIPVP